MKSQILIEKSFPIWLNVSIQWIQTTLIHRVAILCWRSIILSRVGTIHITKISISLGIMMESLSPVFQRILEWRTLDFNCKSIHTTNTFWRKWISMSFCRNKASFSCTTFDFWENANFKNKVQTHFFGNNLVFKGVVSNFLMVVKVVILCFFFQFSDSQT